MLLYCTRNEIWKHDDWPKRIPRAVQGWKLTRDIAAANSYAATPSFSSPSMCYANPITLKWLDSQWLRLAGQLRRLQRPPRSHHLKAMLKGPNDPFGHPGTIALQPWKWAPRSSFRPSMAIPWPSCRINLNQNSSSELPNQKSWRSKHTILEQCIAQCSVDEHCFASILNFFNHVTLTRFSRHLTRKYQAFCGSDVLTHP